MSHGWVSSARRAALLCVVATGLVATTSVWASASSRGTARGSAPPAEAPAASSSHVGFSIELRLGAGVTYRIVTFSNQCADNLELPTDTTKQATQTQWLGFDPSNEIDDGCFTRASWSNYEIFLSGPYSGRIQFSFGDGTNGGTYKVKCLRADSEFGVWCHATGLTSLVIGKLN